MSWGNNLLMLSLFSSIFCFLSFYIIHHQWWNKYYKQVGCYLDMTNEVFHTRVGRFSLDSLLVFDNERQVSADYTRRVTGQEHIYGILDKCDARGRFKQPRI